MNPTIPASGAQPPAAQTKPADDLRQRCNIALQLLPDAEYKTMLSALFDDLFHLASASAEVSMLNFLPDGKGGVMWLSSKPDDDLVTTTTPKPQAGEWTLIAPDGRAWKADSPLRCVSAEQRDRVPADVAMARILSAAQTQTSEEPKPPLNIGDYVLATKWNDGDPNDMWALGYYNGETDGRHYVLDAMGMNLRANGFRRVARIRPDVGHWLLNDAAQVLERCPPGTVSLWSMLTEYAFDLSSNGIKHPACSQQEAPASQEVLKQALEALELGQNYPDSYAAEAQQVRQIESAIASLRALIDGGSKA